MRLKKGLIKNTKSQKLSKLFNLIYSKELLLSDVQHNELEDLIPVENSREVISLNFQSLDRFKIARVNENNQASYKSLDGKSLC